MIVHTEVCGAQKFHDWALQRVGAALFVGFGDDHESSAGFEDAENFPHVVGQVGPVILGFDGGNQVKGIFCEGQAGDGSFFDCDAASCDQCAVTGARGGHAAFGVVHAEKFALGCERGEFCNGATAAAADIENLEIVDELASVRYGEVLQPPVGERRMGEIHHPQEGAAEPTRGFAELSEEIKGDDSGDGIAQNDWQPGWAGMERREYWPGVHWSDERVGSVNRHFTVIGVCVARQERSLDLRWNLVAWRAHGEGQRTRIAGGLG